MTSEPEQAGAEQQSSDEPAAARSVLEEYPVISRILLLINAAGCLAYLSWLVMANKRIFYTQEGVIYLLPFLPFFFVFIYIFGKPAEKEEEQQDGKQQAARDGAAEQDEERIK